MTRRMVNMILVGATILMVAGEAVSEPALREVGPRTMVIGVAVSESDLKDPVVAALVTGQFSSVVATNAFKPDQLQRVAGRFTFETADRIAAFAGERGMAVVGHTLCWHQQTPGWMFAEADGKPLPRERALANLRAHVMGVAGHFKGRVRGWDVVNEVAADGDGGGDLRDTPALRAIGEDYVEQAFRLAHEADPGAELYYTDFNIETPGKRERAVRIVRRLKAAGVRIDAVGIQGHWGMRYPAAAVIDEAIAAFGAEGVKVMVTELDVDVFPYRAPPANPEEVAAKDADPYRDQCPPEVLAAQARRYGDLFNVFMKHRDVMSRVTFWGVHDGTSWLNDFPIKGRTNYPLLWDRHLKPKPALGAVLEALSQ